MFAKNGIRLQFARLSLAALVGALEEAADNADATVTLYKASRRGERGSRRERGREREKRIEERKGGRERERERESVEERGDAERGRGREGRGDERAKEKKRLERTWYEGRESAL